MPRTGATDPTLGLWTLSQDSLPEERLNDMRSSGWFRHGLLLPPRPHGSSVDQIRTDEESVTELIWGCAQGAPVLTQRMDRIGQKRSEHVRPYSHCGHEFSRLVSRFLAKREKI